MYGIDNNIYQWIKSFLTNRHQQVIIDGSISSPIPVTSGVPQGTVLGPILFSIYINDLPEVIKHSTIRLFADDCILYRQIKCTEDAILLQSDINSFMEWASIWQMKLNVDKCHSMSVTLSKLYTISRTYYMDNSPLSQVDSCKYLGVIIQSDLKWNMHVNYITAKANKTLGFLKRNISCASIHAKKLAYTVFIRSQLEYAATVWAPWQSTLISRLEQIQRRAARFVTNTYTRDPTVSVTNLMDQLDWESLESRRLKLRLSMMYKIIHNEIDIPFDLYTNFATYSSTRNYHPFNLLSLQASKTSFFPATISLWNDLPNLAKDSNLLEVFKSIIYLLNYLFFCDLSVHFSSFLKLYSIGK